MFFIPNVKDGRMADPDSPPSIHYTLIFNTFCLMTLFNALNSRKVYGERNIFQVLFFIKIEQNDYYLGSKQE